MRALLGRTLPPDEVAPSLARNALQEVPRLRGDLGRLRLMVSELVTNSVRHGHLHPSDEIQARPPREPEWDPGRGEGPRRRLRGCLEGPGQLAPAIR
jgi:signal transduction histidine kinase